MALRASGFDILVGGSMKAIDAAEANHRATAAYVGTLDYTYNEKIMHAIIRMADSGGYSLTWKYPLPDNTIKWLLSLGYTVETKVCDHKAKLYKFFISWEK